MAPDVKIWYKHGKWKMMQKHQIPSFIFLLLIWGGTKHKKGKLAHVGERFVKFKCNVILVSISQSLSGLYLHI